jgi:hypothetical protein
VLDPTLGDLRALLLWRDGDRERATGAGEVEAALRLSDFHLMLMATVALVDGGLLKRVKRKTATLTLIDLMAETNRRLCEFAPGASLRWATKMSPPVRRAVRILARPLGWRTKTAKVD